MPEHPTGHGQTPGWRTAVLWLACAASLAAEDLRPVCQGSFDRGRARLTISNLTPTLPHDVEHSPSLNPPQWQTLGSFTPTTDTHPWTAPSSHSGGVHYYRVVFDLPDDPYAVYFLRNQGVAAQTVDRFDAPTRTYFSNYLEAAEATGSIAIDPPANLQNCEPPQSCANIYLSPDESRRILAAKAAHAVWVDRNERVPWRLRDYSDEDLRRLFHENYLTARCCNPGNYGYTNCLEALTRNLAQPLPLTPDEMDEAVASLEALCP